MTPPHPENRREAIPQNRIVRYFLVAFAAFLYLPNGLFSDYYLCSEPVQGKLDLCLDESWHTALNVAVERSFVFGKDFVFTYGPLGFLSTRADIGINHLYLLLFDLFIFANIVFILCHAWRSYQGIGSLLVSFIFCFLAPFGDASLKLLLVMLFWLQFALQEDSARHFVVPMVAAVLSFFLKLNTSFVAILIFYLFFVGSILVHRRVSPGQISLAVLLPGVLLLFGDLLNVDIPGYIRTGLGLIGNYSDAMNFIGLSAAKYTIFVAVAALTSSITFCWLFSREKNLWRSVTSICAFVIVTFILFKQAVVRNHVGNLFAFLYFAPMLWLFSLFFLRSVPRRLNFLIGTASVLTVLIGVLPLRYNVKAADFNPFRGVNYFSQLVAGPDEGGKERAVQAFKLPEEVRNLIGSGSVDIIPWNVNLIYFNGLSYDPRPVFQTYAAYSGTLMDLNRRKYEGQNGPDFVILSDETVDGRYGFFDDIGAKIALVENYSVRKSFNFANNEYLLLQRNVESCPIAYGEAAESTLSLYQEYEVKNPDVSYFAKIKIDYSVLGGISRVLYQPLSLKIVFTLADETIREHRAVVPILEGGVIITPYVETTEDYELFFRRETGKLRKVKSFRIEPEFKGRFEKLNASNYVDPFKIESREIVYDFTGKMR